MSSLRLACLFHPLLCSGCPWFNRVQLSRLNKYNAACLTKACALPTVGRLFLLSSQPASISTPLSSMKNWGIIIHHRQLGTPLSAIQCDDFFRRVRWIVNDLSRRLTHRENLTTCVSFLNAALEVAGLPFVKKQPVSHASDDDVIIWASLLVPIELWGPNLFQRSRLELVSIPHTFGNDKISCKSTVMFFAVETWRLELTRSSL